MPKKTAKPKTTRRAAPVDPQIGNQITDRIARLTDDQRRQIPALADDLKRAMTGYLKLCDVQDANDQDAISQRQEHWQCVDDIINILAGMRLRSHAMKYIQDAHANYSPVLALQETRVAVEEVTKELKAIRDAVAIPIQRKPGAPPLSELQKDILRFIKAQPVGEAVLGKDICTHVGINISTLTYRHIPILKEWYGVKNKPNIGYYTDEP